MGTWGTGWFENDTAADFAADLEDLEPSGRPALITARLQAVTGASGYLQNPEADEGLAGAALVAMAGGAGSAVADDEPAAAGLPAPDAEVVALAVAVTARLLRDEDNEWLDLWTEVGQRDAALARLDGLRQALATVTPAAGPTPWTTAPAGRPERRWWQR